MSQSIALTVILFLISLAQASAQANRADSLANWINWIDIIDSLAWECYDSGDYAEAVRKGQQAMAVQELVLGTENEDYAILLKSVALYQSEYGNYEEAVRLEEQALTIQERVLGTENVEYAQTLEMLALYQSECENCEEAARLEEQALAIQERVLGTENVEYAQTLEMLAFYKSECGNYEEAVRLEEQALAIQERVLGTENVEYAQSLSMQAFYKSECGNYEETVRLEEQSLAIQERVLGTEDYVYVCLARLDWLINNPLRLAQGAKALLNLYATKATSANSNFIKSTFSVLNRNQRANLWKDCEPWYKVVAHHLTFGLPSDTLVANGYNAVLLSKGLLLNSEIEFTKLMQQSGDEETMNLFNVWRAQLNRIRKMHERNQLLALNGKLPIAWLAWRLGLGNRYQPTDSLSREADRVEQELVERSKVYGDFTKNLVITWLQVQEKLGERDAAVEFVSFPWTADSTMYIAYALRKDWDCPRMIPLFEEKELEAVEGYDYYTTPSVSHLVWEPLEEALEGADRVFFSPGGDLYNIAIESVPDHLDPAHLVSDRRDYFRLSSTRELALIQDDYTWTEGAVYGGLNYNMGISSLAADEAHYVQSSSNGQRERGVDLSYYYLGGEGFAEGIRSDRKSSGLLDSLPGTREEAVAIKAQLDDISVPSSLYTDDLGTEASFKALDGQRTSIIHIGTHGFFNTKKAEYKDQSALLMTSNQQTVRVEDDALSRSGLCMAGANNLLTNAEALPDSLDDGWLTALEIAHLDLRGLDMVVLSACKTGVGEVTGDGVFGLQRGFKKAGARTLVMSLWNVPDQLTCYFMKEFFARIEVDKNGHPTNKHAAFLQAQQAARTNWQEVDPNAAPYDWAAFILLDGVR